MGGCMSNPALPPPEKFCKARKPLEPTLFPGMVNLDQIRTYILQRQFWSWTGNDYTVVDNFGTPMCLMTGNVFTMRNRTALKDLNGNVVCVVIEKMMSLHQAFYIYSVCPRWEGQQFEETHEGIPLYAFAKLNQKAFSVHHESCLLLAAPATDGGVAWVNLYDIQTPRWFANNMLVTDCSGGTGVALLDEPMWQFDPMKYWAITVSPGVDPMLMFATCMIVDELRDRARRREEEDRYRNGGIGCGRRGIGGGPAIGFGTLNDRHDNIGCGPHIGGGIGNNNGFGGGGFGHHDHMGGFGHHDHIGRF